MNKLKNFTSLALFKRINKRTMLGVLLILLIVSATFGAILLFNESTREAFTTATRAFTNTDTPTDTCNLVEISSNESTSCPDIAPGDGQTNNISNYVTNHTLRNISGQSITVQYKLLEFWCEEPYVDAVSNSQVCINYYGAVIKEATLGPGETLTETIQNEITINQVCGRYQNDIQILSVNGNTNCTTARLLEGYVQGWGMCKTGIECTTPICTGIQISYTDQNGQQRTATNNDYQSSVQAAAGTQVTVTNLLANGNPTTDGVATDYDVTELIKSDPNTRTDDLVAIARANNNLNPVPFVYTLPSQANKTIQINGALNSNPDPFRVNNACAVRIVTVPSNVQPTNPPPTNVPPTSVPPTNVPPTGVPPTDVPPTAVPTQPPRSPQGCGAITLIIDPCEVSPTPSPTPAPACGEPCVETSNGPICPEDHTCITAVNGAQICARNDLQTYCIDNPTRNGCCVDPSPTPSPTPSLTPTPTLTPIVQQQQQQQQQQVVQPVVQQQQQQQQPVVVQQPQQVVQPTQVQYVQPTYTPVPPPPTYTLIPTFTPYPTQQPQPTYQPQQLVEAGSPLPWIIAGIPVVTILLGMFL